MELIATLFAVLGIAALPAIFCAVIVTGMEKRFNKRQAAKRYYGKYA